MDVLNLGYSYPWGKAEIADFLLPKLPEDAHILDVGAGSGTYREILGHDFYWSAIEIWHETAQYLRSRYDEVYELDIRKFEYPEHYELVIFGDVLEHLFVSDAQKVLMLAMKNSNQILVAVPFNLHQDMMYGNAAEEHLQPDLNIETMQERYPDLRLIHCVTSKHVPIYGYYYWGKNS